MIVWLAALALAGPIRTDRTPPSVAWHTLQTRFFAIHHPDGAERTAREVARIADDLLLDIAGQVGWDPIDTVHVVITDDSDEMTAFTYPRWGWIVLSADPGQYLLRLRGRQDWVPDALAHELGHLVGHRAAGAVPPVASYGVTIGGLAEGRRVAAGVVVPIGPNEPYGWSEGAAELWSEGAGVNLWTPSRDATVRTAALEGRLLDWDEWLVATDKSDTGDAERAYQQGYAFARWLRDRYGHDVFAAMAAPASRKLWADWGRLLEEVTGEPGRHLWALWRAEATADAAERAAQVRAEGVVAGAEVELWPGPWEPRDVAALDRWERRAPRDREEAREATGSWDLYPRFSPDGRWYAEGRVGWVKVALLDEDRLPGLLGRPPESWDVETVEWIPARFGSAFSFVPGRDAIVVAAPGRGDRNRLHVVDLTPRRRTTPIPGTERARDPTVSPDGERVAWVQAGGGSHELVVANLDGTGRRALSSFGDGTWLQHPSWSPDGKALVVSALRTDRPDLWRVDVATGAWTQLTADPQDELDPWWGPDGIWFVSDPDGIFDVFRLDLEGGVQRATRVIGGAMTPSLTPSGNLLYTAVTAHGHKAMALHRSEWPLDDVTDRFETAPDPEEAARDLAWRPPPVPGESRRYSPLRGLLPVALGPEIRIDAPAGRPVVLGGGLLRIRDALEQVELSALGLVGEDWLGEARLSWRWLGPELSVWALGSSDRRVLPDRVHRRAVEAGGAEAAIRVAEGLVASVGLEGGQLELGEVGAVAPALRTLRGVVQLERGEPLEGEPGWSGALTWTPGYTDATAAATGSRDGRLRRPYTWQRGTIEVDGIVPTLVRTGPLAEHRHELEIGAWAGLVSRDVALQEELRAGGDAPNALRLGALEPSVPFPGYAPFAIAGEALVVGRVGWVVPLAPRMRAGSAGVHLRGIEARIGGDFGRAWSWQRDRLIAHVPVLADVTAGLRLRGLLLDAPWDSVVQVAWGLGELPPVAPADPGSEPPRAGGGVRLVLGLGTGF